MNSKPPPPPPSAVRVRQGWLTLPTYESAPPDRNPMFLEKRVYQGSSGKVYPLPMIDRIAEKPAPRKWKAIWIENEFLQALVLPEIGGRIHRLLDKTNGYDVIYHQPVIKPALVGLAGPWISGGIEFNWPQHHRPATFLPVDTEIETHDDGSVTVWCGDHDPLQRMKAMHGVCLHPGRAVLELKVRVHNRTPFTQTFLWWANVATRVHEGYQSFFPPDVYYVADHARRSMSEYPLARGRYYGVDYGERGRKGVPAAEVPGHGGKSEIRNPKTEANPKPETRSALTAALARASGLGLAQVVRSSVPLPGEDVPRPPSPRPSPQREGGAGSALAEEKRAGVRRGLHPVLPLPAGEGRGEGERDTTRQEVRISDLPHYPPNDLSFYANIPVPTSYMCMGSQEDFFGGYDWKAQAGIVHVADHHIAPGKKQWTWGNHEFGYAWDRNLTDADASGEHPPYIELMAGVFTDNQPDFSFLQPGETKSWSQYWYPIQQIGPAQHANLDAALALRVVASASPNGKAAEDCRTPKPVGLARHSDPRASVVDRGSPLPLSASATGLLRLGVSVTRAFPKARMELFRLGAPEKQKGGVLPNAATRKSIAHFTRDLAPGKPFVTELKLPRGLRDTDLLLRVTDRAGREIISYQPKPRAQGEVPPPATEPPAPADLASADELFITGLHLDQYRHATRCPTLYWREALRRDPGDARCNNALGLWHLKRGEFAEAEAHFRTAIARLTRRNANPADGEPFYNLGLCLRYQADALGNDEGRMSNDERMTKLEARKPYAPALLRASDFGLPSAFDIRHSSLLREAYAAFAKATWNAAWAGPAFLALAELDCRLGDWTQAIEHAHRAYQASAYNQRAMNLWALALRKGGDPGYAETMLRAFRRTDPLDWWTRHLLGEPMTCDTQTLLDLALDYARAGFYTEAIELLGARASARFTTPPPEAPAMPGDATRSPRRSGLKSALPADPRDLGTAPLLHYYLGWLHTQLGHTKAALAEFRRAAAAPPDYCFPARLEEIAILQAAIAANPADARAPYCLGNLLYDHRRHEDAIRLWERSAKLDPTFSVVWRNLGIGYFNVRRQPAKARAAYERAFRANPADARLLFERDQLWKRLGEKPAKRLRELEKHLDLVHQRDDLSVELCALYNQVGRPAAALAVLSGRRFQPWEGGEGGPLGQWVRAHLALGRAALGTPVSSVRYPVSNSTPNTPASALAHFQSALTAPRNLGEAKHLLANQSDIHYWLGCARAALGDAKQARQHWRTAVTFKGDFQEMSVRAFSEMTYYSALAWEKLGQRDKARKLLRDLLAHAQTLQRAEAKMDYFATSLPTMLLFEDDLQFRQETTALFLQAQARLGLGQRARGAALLQCVLRRDPIHALAADLTAELSRNAAVAIRRERRLQSA